MKIFLLSSFIFAGSLMAYDTVLPSKTPPGDLDPQTIPMFISLGFDDNKFRDGVDWARDTLFAGRVNNSGKGNLATYDGTPMRASFYVIGNADYSWRSNYMEYFTAPIPSDRTVSDSWRRAYDEGFAINNHTFTHGFNLYDLDPYRSTDQRPSMEMELGMCNKYLVNVVGIPVHDIYGFRTPYLAATRNNVSFTVSWELGLLYDCTLNNGMQGNRPAEWTRAMFPGVMNEGWGHPAVASAYATPGLWQYPNGTYPLSEGGSFSDAGFDSGPNGWARATSAEEFFNQMRWAIEYHYETNRAPIDLGLHTEYYSHTNAGRAHKDLPTTVEERQRALVMLLDWIESDLPDARVVTKQDVLYWMKNPVALDDLSNNHKFTFSDEGGSGMLNLSSAVAVSTDGSIADIKDGNRVDVTVADSVGNWVVDSYAGVYYPFNGSIDEAHSLRITYSSDIPLRVVLVDEDYSFDRSFSMGLATAENRVVEVPISTYSFIQPRPFTEKRDLRLDRVTGIAILAEVIDSTITASLEASVEIFGAGDLGGDIVSILPNSERVGADLIPGEGFLQISVPSDGQYRLTQLDLSGRVLQQLELNLSAGATTLPLGENSFRGVSIYRLEGGALDISRRAVQY